MGLASGFTSPHMPVQNALEAGSGVVQSELLPPAPLDPVRAVKSGVPGSQQWSRAADGGRRWCFKCVDSASAAGEACASWCEGAGTGESRLL